MHSVFRVYLIQLWQCLDACLRLNSLAVRLVRVKKRKWLLIFDAHKVSLLNLSRATNHLQILHWSWNADDDVMMMTII